MRKLKLYIAMSLDGKIAGPDDDVKWLEEIPSPDKLDYGYGDFYESVDTTIMGNSTYKMILNFGGKFPYPDSKNYVLSRDSSQKGNDNVSFIHEDPIDFVKNLKSEQGKDIWLIGGGQVNSLFLEAGVIDELLIFVMPIILGKGVDLFDRLSTRSDLELVDSRVYNTGVCELRYIIKK